MADNRNFFSPEQETEVVRLYEEERLSINQIAAHMKVSRTPVINCLSRHKVVMRPRGGRWLTRPRDICPCGENTITYISKGLCSPCYNLERNKDPKVQERRFNWKLKKNFGITREDYDRILEEQRGICAICKQLNPRGIRLEVDHDHSCCPGWYENCGKCTRGLLCHRCNSAVGYLKDSIENAENLISYLKKYR